MAVQLFIYWLLIPFIQNVSAGSMDNYLVRDNTLHEQHLRILAYEYPFNLRVTTNSTGQITKMEGPMTHVLDTLSRTLNFSYTMLPEKTSVFDDTIVAKGAVTYLANNEADYVISTAIGTAERYEKVDYPTYWYFGPFGSLVPYPQENINLAAALQPLSYEVWILVIVVVFAVIVCLRILRYGPQQRFCLSTAMIGPEQHIPVMTEIVLYVLGNLLSQGQRCYSKCLDVRVVAGVWCLGCFFLVQIYCCTLTSHLMSQNQKLLVNSVDEIMTTPGIKLTVDRGWGVDVILSQNEGSTKIKKLGEILSRDPSLRCDITSDCLKNVDKGNIVYLGPVNPMKVLVDLDVKKTNTCHYSILKEGLWSSPVYTALKKKTPHVESMSRAILRIREAGLVDLWIRWYTPPPSKCMDINQNSNQRRMSLGNLSSAFTILIAGYIISIFVFGVEKIYERATRKPSRNNNLRRIRSGVSRRE